MQVRTDWISFYDTHYHRVVRFVMHNGASQADAQDAAQEAFIESWALMSSDPSRWQAITGKEAWIRTVALRRYRRPPGPRRRPADSRGTRYPICPPSDPGMRNSPCRPSWSCGRCGRWTRKRWPLYLQRYAEVAAD